MREVGSFVLSQKYSDTVVLKDRGKYQEWSRPLRIASMLWKLHETVRGLREQDSNGSGPYRPKSINLKRSSSRKMFVSPALGREVKDCISW